MNNKTSKILIGLTAVIVLAVIAYFALFCQCDGTEIFHQSISSVVELKAVSGARESYGSAVCIGTDGVLVTNAHVVSYLHNGSLVPYDEIYIRSADEETYHQVELICFDDALDLAFLSAPSNINISDIPIRNSDNIDFGERVYAVGNSMNSGLSIAEGIVSIPKIEIEYDGKMRTCIQADVTISSGNSGGALLDHRGRLIGITTFRIKDMSGNIVYGNAYAIPINIVQEYVKSIK